VDLSGALPIGGLRAAVEAVCTRYERRGLAVGLTVDDTLADTPPEVTAALVRVLNEALANAAKHANAAAVAVELRSLPGAVTVVVADDGGGFDPEAAGGSENGHLGLSLMRARAREAAGDLEIRSAPGGGTTVSARFPLASRPR
jgi:signal transduction histidine kinase